MKLKWIAPLAAVALTTTPVAAQVSRSSAPAATAESQLDTGSSTIGWVILVAILGWTTYLIIDNENDNDRPASP
jgi:hypothetical protein